MSRAPDEQLTREEPLPSPAALGYAEWLRMQLKQAMADLAAPERVEIEHDTVFAELDRLIAEHEIR